jgi:hypothetical protein
LVTGEFEPATVVALSALYHVKLSDWLDVVQSAGWRSAKASGVLITAIAVANSIEVSKNVSDSFCLIIELYKNFYYKRKNVVMRGGYHFVKFIILDHKRLMQRNNFQSSKSKICWWFDRSFTNFNAD